MGALFVLAGLLALIAVAVSGAIEWWSWRGLDDESKAEQREIKLADLAVHAAQRQHKKRLSKAEREISIAETPVRRAKYGELELFDDRVKSGRHEYPLSNKTKPKVVARGRGDERSVMVLLEDVNWQHSINATKIGKSNEFDAQQFAADVRVLAPQAVAARALRAEAVTEARRQASVVAADTADLEAARSARLQLGERLRASGNPPGKRWRRAAAPAAVAALALGGVLNAPASAPQTAAADAGTAQAESTKPQTTEPATPDETIDRAALRQSARELVAQGDYVGAQDTVTDLAPADRSYVRRLASARAARVTQNALKRGDRAAAARALKAAHGLPHTSALAAAERTYRAAVAAASNKRHQASASRRDSANGATATRSTTATSTTESYAGMTCPEIGHSFMVEPGSDLEHDRDGDGVACESQ